MKETLMMTNKRLFNLRDNKIFWSIDILELQGLAKNPKNDDFKIYAQSHFLHNLNSEDRDLIFKFISEAYKEVSKGQDLPIFGVDYLNQWDILPPLENKLDGEDAFNIKQMYWSESSKP